MKTQLSGLSMVAVGLASLAMLPACGMGEDEGLGVPAQHPAVEFDAPNNYTDDDTSKACFVRSDYVADNVLHSGWWGSWAACRSFCPEGSYALSIQTKSQAGQGGDSDDTALNGVRLHCFDLRTGAATGVLKSKEGGWGSWSAVKNVDPFITGNPFVSGRMRMESPRGPLDDTAANAIKLTARLGGAEVQPADQRGWGDWQLFTQRCPAGTAVCGIQTIVEGVQGGYSRTTPPSTGSRSIVVASRRDSAADRGRAAGTGRAPCLHRERGPARSLPGIRDIGARQRQRRPVDANLPRAAWPR